MRSFVPREGSRPTVVVVGEGLIGAAVSDRLRRRRWGEEIHVATDWSRPDTLGGDLERVLDDAGRRVELVWSAGTADMSLEGLDADGRRQDFAQLVAQVVGAGGGETRVHHVSSAGALGPPGGTDRFDVGVSAYAVSKSIEEEVGARLVDRWRVYRVSSVYGAPRSGARAGVIGTMVRNGLLGRETPLYARTSTMRNYVHSLDVGEAIVRGIEDDADSTELIAAPRSHAMSEVVAEVERAIRRTVPVSYRPPRNHHDMVFDPATISPLVPLRPLAGGVRLVREAVLGA